MNLWESKIPDRPHVDSPHHGMRGDGSSFRECCYLCDEEYSYYIYFVHNEGCHSGICPECIRRMSKMLDEHHESLPKNDGGP
jgi:hypothetical protein